MVIYMKSNTSETPLVCNMNVFTAAQHEAHIQTTTQLVEAVQNIREVENGYEFSFPNEKEFLRAEFGGAVP